jgi:site-specific DNA recombinase
LDGTLFIGPISTIMQGSPRCGQAITSASILARYGTKLGASMGRLTLNVLLSFAQFEREVAGERIRDKFAASRRKGMWMGGTVPLGDAVKDRKLVINEAEADRPRPSKQKASDQGADEANRHGCGSADGGLVL